MAHLRRQTEDGEVFHLVLIKPTHYDSAGYPIRWLRSYIPSNTLACMNALAKDARERQVLGNAVDIRLHLIDETNTLMRFDAAVERGTLNANDVSSWKEAYQFIQLLRMRGHQRQAHAGEPLDNHADPDDLNELDRRILKEAFRQARKLQSKVALEYQL